MAAPLVHSKLDPWLLGGFALAINMLALAFYDPQISAQNLFLLMPWLLLGISYPHFVASYFLFYKQPGILRRARFTAFLLPLALILILGISVFLRLDKWMTAFGHAGLAFLYWHYSKQSFGASIWLMHGEARGQMLPIPKQILLVTCLALACSGYVTTVSQPSVVQAFGMYLFPFDWPEAMIISIQAIANCCVLFSLGFGVFQSYRHGSWSSLVYGAIPLAALWSWVEPSMQTPWIMLALPVFHGLQYLPFAFRVWSNESRGSQYVKIAKGVALTVGVGYLLFRYLPQSLAHQSSQDQPALTLAPAAVLCFLNIHHYFIDAHMWRLKDASVRRRLLGTAGL